MIASLSAVWNKLNTLHLVSKQQSRKSVELSGIWTLQITVACQMYRKTHQRLVLL